MIQIGVYSVGSRDSARRNVSLRMARIFARRSGAAVDEGAQALEVARIEHEVIVPAAGEPYPLHGASPSARETLRMAGRDERIALADEDKRGRADRGRPAHRVERMAREP